MSTRTLRSTRQSTASQQDNTEKENTSKQHGVKQEPKARAKPASKASKSYCICRQPDDGSPMILCSECKEWYHFKCLDLDEREAEDIQIFVCPACHEKSGLRTVMDWEGPDALESRNATQTMTPTPIKEAVSPEPTKQLPETPESSDDGSADEYVAEDTKTKLQPRRGHPRVNDSDSESDGNSKRKTSARHPRRPSTVTVTTRMRAVSSSPGPSTPLKRKHSTATIPEPKRKRSESAAAGAGPDAARKYCLTKLHDLFRDIFLRHPVLGEPADDEEPVAEKKPEELSSDDKEQLGAKANQFATELEECIFELYGEPDVKTGKHGVGAKYKERFRMITFNLSKPDRVVLHKRIASSRISPKELSTMSSTDLADEDTKQSIKQAEQEALEQTILKKIMMPTAKMTHKGMQDIEDVTGTSRLEREQEREHEREEEDRIERERHERLKLQAQRAARGSAPPDSPVTPSTPGWGAPPPVPVHALHPHDPSASPTIGRSPVNPLVYQTSTEIVHTPVEHELNLDDLINIDEEPGQEVSISFATPVLPAVSDSASPSTDAQGSPDPSASTSSASGPLSISATGISPFASRSAHSDLLPRPSFDLSAIWSPKDSAGPSMQASSLGESRTETLTGSPTDMDIAPDEAEDQDFDMFLNGVDDDPEPAELSAPVEIVQETFDSQPSVWKGKISMPLDSTIPQEVDVKAQLVGGRKLAADSLLWKTLFPAEHLRIDGRVPVDKSALYLTQMRLNPSRELIAVAFSPESEASAGHFALLSRFLLDKGRHGLVFPWGHRPKEHHPGRELYIVPLVADEPLPDFVELLDDLQLPKDRTANYLIGIWVLTRDKLAPPPAAPLPPTPVPTAPPASATPPIAPYLSPPTQATLPLPLSMAPLFPPPPPAPAPGVPALTPEQIQLMLRTLSASSAVALPPAVPPPSWAGMPPFAPPFAPTLPPFVPPPPYEQGRPPYGYAPPAPLPPPPGPPPRGGHPYEPFAEHGPRPERGHRSRGGRNRGRSQQGQQQQQPLGERPRDMGWGGRGRGRGGASPDRGRWGGSPQRWG